MLLGVLLTLNAAAQTTTSSPYSQFGLGDLKKSLLPQNRAMGGISMGMRKAGGYYYNNINLANPASFSSINLTTFDVGLNTSVRQLSRNSISENSFNGSLSHLTFAMPVTRPSVSGNGGSALSFGLIPYSELGYTFRNRTKLDTTTVDYVYGGDGGVAKAYLGYGINIGKNLAVGATLGYLFGNLKEIRSTEMPYDPTALNSRTENTRSVGGLSYEYGIQYTAKVSEKASLILGYAGNAGKKITAKNNSVTYNYRYQGFGVETDPLDTTDIVDGAKSVLKMPMTHSVGFVLQRETYWLVGADISMGQWSDYSIDGQNAGLNNSFGVAIGGQFTPDPTAVNRYFKMMEYRFGLRYDKTYFSIGSNDIKETAFSFGFGFPLPANNATFYKINLSAELGQRGTLDNNLVRERFVNINLGFTLNDTWFRKRKYD